MGGSSGGLLAVTATTIASVVVIYIVLTHGKKAGQVITGTAQGYSTFARGLQP